MDRKASQVLLLLRYNHTAKLKLILIAFKLYPEMQELAKGCKGWLLFIGKSYVFLLKEACSNPEKNTFFSLTSIAAYNQRETYSTKVCIISGIVISEAEAIEEGRTTTFSLETSRLPLDP